VSLPRLRGIVGGGVLGHVLTSESSELVDEELDPEDADEDAKEIESERSRRAMVLES
jgi:hypothetical protein